MSRRYLGIRVSRDAGRVSYDAARSLVVPLWYHEAQVSREYHMTPAETLMSYDTAEASRETRAYHKIRYVSYDTGFFDVSRVYHMIVWYHMIRFGLI